MQCRCGAILIRDVPNENEDWPCGWCWMQICGFCHGSHNDKAHPEVREVPPPYRYLTWRDLKV
jgi:hypothetical protein